MQFVVSVIDRSLLWRMDVFLVVLGIYSRVNDILVSSDTRYMVNTEQKPHKIGLVDLEFLPACGKVRDPPTDLLTY